MIAIAKRWRRTTKRWRENIKAESNLSTLSVSNAVWIFLLDYYLTSSEDFGHALKDIDARNVLDAISLQLTDSDLEEEQQFEDDAAKQAVSGNESSS